jgi:hypothetical protein
MPDRESVLTFPENLHRKLQEGDHHQGRKLNPPLSNPCQSFFVPMGVDSKQYCGNMSGGLFVASIPEAIRQKKNLDVYQPVYLPNG